ncbi:MAG: hypothetical protein ABR520_11130 [Mycobacteriales bacterium]|nr:hypothetical protein [Actinomycetota bacterium]
MQDLAALAAQQGEQLRDQPARVLAVDRLRLDLQRLVVLILVQVEQRGGASVR